MFYKDVENTKTPGAFWTALAGYEGFFYRDVENTKAPGAFWTALAGSKGIFYRDVENTKTPGAFWTALAGSEGIFYRDVENKKPALGRFNGGRRRIRTSDRSVRSRVLYPAELCVRCTTNCIHPASNDLC
jgi:hypothetical protein